MVSQTRLTRHLLVCEMTYLYVSSGTLKSAHLFTQSATRECRQLSSGIGAHDTQRPMSFTPLDRQCHRREMQLWRQFQRALPSTVTHRLQNRL